MNVLEQHIEENWAIYNGDSCEIIKGIPTNSIDYSIFSPPFASLYTYSNSERDMGNCASDDEFYKHFRYLVEDLFRITKPGRLLSFHCMNIPTLKSRDGFIGIKDFRGDLIRMFCEVGWIFHSEVVIWKDPVQAMQRTKAIGLLHKQIVKDSSISRQGLPDYLITMRKPGENSEPVDGCFNAYTGNPEDEPTDEYTGDFEGLNRYSINVWQRYASPVWMDIRQNRTLNKGSARNEDDERHICPLQLDVIERCIELWTNPGDIVFSPFLGIGSEGYVAVRNNRKFIGIELKKDYYQEALENIQNHHVSENVIKDIKKAKSKEEKERNKSKSILAEALPIERKDDEYVESGFFVKVNGMDDLIENHFARSHRFGEYIPSDYRDYLNQDLDKLSSFQVANKLVFNVNDHKSKFDFGIQFFLLQFYKFIQDEETNKFQLSNIRKGQFPEVFKKDSRMSKVSYLLKSLDKGGILGEASELRGYFKK